MKRLSAAVLVGAVALGMTACDDFLDVNDNPNTPETVSANLYLPPMMHWWGAAPQWDGRFLGRYTQMWTLPHTSGVIPSTWDRHYYDPLSDNAAQQWRDVYWTFGQGLVDMINKAEAEQRWDLLGVGYLLKGWGWMVLTDMHGEIIVTQAIDPTRFTFDYDSQEVVYTEVLRLLDLAIENLERTDGAVDQGYLAVGDKLLDGDREHWLRTAHGFKAIALNHFSNKASYNPAAVIAEVDLSLTGPEDDVVMTYPGTSAGNPPPDLNFYSRRRGNIPSYRQTTFMVGLVDGTAFDGVVDPRLTRILVPDSTGTYRGVDPNIGFVGMPTDERPFNLHGYAGTGGLNEEGRYLFDEQSKIPVITHSQLQFVKAEAAYHMGNLGLAREAYIAGIRSHMKFVNARNAETGNPALIPISDAEIDAFLANPEIVPATITLSHIMSQKFIAQFGWAFNEAWLDLRRYDYTDMDPASGTQVFRGFSIPTNLHSENNGQPAYRVRPRYNSEYVWNRSGLDAIGGLATDYHTKKLWIIQQ